MSFLVASCGPKHDRAAARQSAQGVDATITLRPAQDGIWSVEFQFSDPQSAVLFPNAQNDYRAKSWSSASPGARLIRHEDMDILAIDPPARRVEFMIEPWSEVLPRDYTPALAFSGGGYAFHIRQFEIFSLPSLDVAQSLKPDLSNLSGDAMVANIRFETDEISLIQGRVADGPVSVLSTQDLGYVYVGPGPAIETARYSGLIDANLPEWIRESFNEDLDAAFTFMEDQFGSPLMQTLSVLYSDEGRNFAGTSIGGSTLQGPTLTMAIGGKEFIGPPSQDLRDAVQSTLVHEVAHLFQKRLTKFRGQDPWLHEGHAVAAANHFMGGSYANERDRARCLDTIQVEVSLSAALARQPYECGAVVWARADRLMVNVDIYRLWDHMMSRSPDGRIATDDFIQALTDLAPPGRDMQRLVRALKGEPIRIDLARYLIQDR